MQVKLVIHFSQVLFYKSSDCAFCILLEFPTIRAHHFFPPLFKLQFLDEVCFQKD